MLACDWNYSSSKMYVELNTWLPPPDGLDTVGLCLCVWGGGGGGQGARAQPGHLRPRGRGVRGGQALGWAAPAAALDLSLVILKIKDKW